MLAQHTQPAASSGSNPYGSVARSRIEGIRLVPAFEAQDRAGPSLGAGVADRLAPFERLHPRLAPAVVVGPTCHGTHKRHIRSPPRAGDPEPGESAAAMQMGAMQMGAMQMGAMQMG